MHPILVELMYKLILLFAFFGVVWALMKSHFQYEDKKLRQRAEIIQADFKAQMKAIEDSWKRTEELEQEIINLLQKKED